MECSLREDDTDTRDVTGPVGRGASNHARDPATPCRATTKYGSDARDPGRSRATDDRTGPSMTLDVGPLRARSAQQPITREQRLEELHRHPAAPPGLEAHAMGLRHEVQKGDSAWSIARDYAQAYHLDLTAGDLTRANPTAMAGGLHPGELLELPMVQSRMDAAIRAAGVGAPAVQHTVARGDTLSSIARRYDDRVEGTLTWKQVYDANRAVIGANPNVIRPGQVLVIPGTGRPGGQVAPLQTLSELDQDIVLTRVGRVQHEAGGIEQLDIVRFRADASHAEQHASIADAIAAARSTLASDEPRSNPMAIVQVRDGSAWTVPVRGEEVSDNLDDSDRTLSLAYRAGEREVVAVVDRPWDQPVRVRRFDR
jgi:LysM repeat protein